MHLHHRVSIVFFCVVRETKGKRGNMATRVTFGPYKVHRCTSQSAWDRGVSRRTVEEFAVNHFAAQY